MRVGLSLNSAYMVDDPREGVRSMLERVDAAHTRALDIFTAKGLPWRRADALRGWAAALDARGDAAGAAARRAEAEEVHVRIGAAGRWLR